VVLALDAALHVAKQKTVALLLQSFLLLVDTLLVAFLFEIFLPAHLLLPRTARSVGILFEGHSLGSDSGLRAFIFLPKSESRAILADHFYLLLATEFFFLLEHGEALLLGALLVVLGVVALGGVDEEVGLVDGVLLL
jgi:hypothetical protein